MALSSQPFAVQCLHDAEAFVVVNSFAKLMPSQYEALVIQSLRNYKNTSFL